MQVTVQEAVMVLRFLRRCSTLGQHQTQVSDDGRRSLWRSHSCDSVDKYNLYCTSPFLLARCGAVACGSMV